ncbi:MAG: hypothetical protein HEQ27_06275 [Dolichospermum sp. JUN01]|jgi:hypothetical protein|uniref:Uncharacterized protein n=1 Tax=Aphanizomenon flos-aquae FACHB-1040 TaxID=2692887 RepID=A0ABR8BVI5_APHFL|nr:hypothetical protein [Aphanizomenon flos-aquae]MBO1056142.1 hypothetical protein [Dolichospermum sp. JUN01]MBO1072868.1 hypothetical protein [Dolichospermum sp. DEX189]MBS9391571.1 hypothetical protein [Dolichospermum sp. WA123]MBS9396111.1 hypothetical protein [Dolichospermum sp. OL01]MCO5799801.1 hypothetical protein [Dolichospermum sp. OL03]MCS6280732.1 hypothetical protein [Dolichospermum sp.]
MIEPKEILIQAIEQAMSEGMTNAKLSRASGVNNSMISRLLSREREDIRSGDFFKLVHSLPEHIKSATLGKLGVVSFDLAAIAASSPPEEKARVLEAIAHSLTVQNKEKAKAVA